MSAPPEKQAWSGRFAFLMATVGSAVGLGSIWKFPYMVGANGGSAFLFAYLASLVVLILPLMIGEFVIGRRGGKSAVGSLAKVAVESGATSWWGAVGAWGVLTGFLILSFYSVIGGWTIAYVPQALSNAFAGQSPESIGASFGAMLADPVGLAFHHAVFMAMTAVVVARGISDGIERAVTFLMPLMFIILIGLVGYAFATADIGAAATFFFKPDWSKLTPEVALSAIGLGFFSIGTGIGAMITYAAYAPREIRLGQAAVWTIAADTFASFLAAFAIFPLVFAYGLNPGEGAGLMFTTLPIAFGQMPAGAYVGAAFFLLLVISALASAISLLELVVAWVTERVGVARPVAAYGSALICWVIGLGTVLSFNNWSKWFPLASVPPFETKTFFDIVDYLTSNIMLPLGGIFLGLFVGWVMSKEAVLAELGLKDGPRWRALQFLLGIVVPIVIFVLFVANLGFVKLATDG
ncbi:MAG: sodium-dependent transporter [Alphaproteobacteria bacterium]|nr:sodium-dependent transporter [Alphaproteobacteria bacterium]